MRTRTKAAVGLLSAIGLVFSSGVAAHPEDQSDGGAHGGGSDGHVAANTNYGFEAVGHSALSGVQDGRYTDVWAHEGFAYVGSFQDPDCSRAGVYIADLADPTSPEYVGQIKSPPNTRVNDVKVTTVGKRDVLIFSLEKCGRSVSSGQKGKGGISLWDVTDPTNPHALKQQFLDFQVHNTFPWTVGNKTYALVVDDENTDDLHVVDISKPQAPKLIATTGIGTWEDAGFFDEDESELFLGTFATPLLHDVWVEYNPTTARWEGVLSYWDAGFITVDLTDPSNPTFIADSDYLDQDPILAEERAAFGGRPEGNAHAGVFGGDDNEFIFGGDEDFDATAITVTQGDLAIAANSGSDTPAPTDENGPLTFVGEACGGVAAGAGIALIERGTCAFTTKAANITAAGYSAGIVFNSAPNGCSAGIGMLVEGTVPMVSIPRSDGYALMGLDCAAGDAVPGIGSTYDAISMGSSFVGWGYFWAINNSGAPVSVSGTPASKAGSTMVDAMGTMGYYAPAEVADDGLATGFGDLTMHNLETDIAADGRERTFISWYALGLRAVEWREGHFHDNSNGEGSYSWNIHEVGRWIADAETVAPFAEDAGIPVADMVGSNFWGVTQFEQNGQRYILGSDRNTGLWVFEWDCDTNPEGPLYCGDSNGD